MGAFQRKFTDEQRQAFVKAVLDAELPQKQVRDLAAHGQLDGLDPFHVPASTGYEWVSVERLKRAGEEVKGTPELSTVLLDQARRLTVMNERKIRRLEALDRANKDVPISQLKGCATVVRTLTFAQPKRTSSKPEQNTTSPAQDGTETPGLLTRLAQTETSHATTSTTPVQTDDTSHTSHTTQADSGDTEPRFASPPELGDRARARLRPAV